MFPIIKSKWRGILGLVVMSFSLQLWGQVGVTHPELDPEERYIPCRDCHKTETPEVYEEWYNSLHGIANVRCYQCHGNIEAFQTTPVISKCESCHSDQMKKMNLPTGFSDKNTCWSCHPNHGLRVHE